MIYLLADIGGTNTRCAISGADRKPENIQVFKNRDFPEPVMLLEHYLKSLGPRDKPSRGAFAVAGPVNDGAVQMVNIDWHLSAKELRNQLNFERVTLMNDFSALANALPEFSEDELRKIGSGSAVADEPKVVLGPGTGLGVASLVPVNGEWQAISGEGGHITMAAADDEEARIISTMRDKFGHCSAERLISGSGLSLLHSTIHAGTAPNAIEIAKLADHGDRDAEQTFEVFFRMLGTVAGNLAVTLGAFGGVYIGGGIIPKHAKRFAASGFRKRFEAKGRYRDYLQSIPTYLIVAEYPALTGLAACAQRN